MTEFRTYVVQISEEGEDRFPFGFSPSKPKTTTTIAGDFDFPLDFEFTTSGIFGAYAGIPNYLKVDSAGRTQYYFLTPISVASPKYENAVSVKHAYKFRAHKDVFASFNVEDITFKPASRIYQGHYLGGYSYYARNNAYAPDWTTNTTRYMPYHIDTIRKIYPLAQNTAYRVFVFFTRKSTGDTAGARMVLCTTTPIYNLSVGADSVSLFLFQLSSMQTLKIQYEGFNEPTEIGIESIDDVYVVPTNIATDAHFGVGGDFVHGSGHIVRPYGQFDIATLSGGDYSGGFVEAYTTWQPDSDLFNTDMPKGTKIAYEIGCGSSWVRLLPRVTSSEPSSNMRPKIVFSLIIGKGSLFQLIMTVIRDRDIQSIDLSAYCTIPYQWRDLDTKADQKTAAGVQLASSVLQTAASVALAYPTGGVSLVGAIGGATSLYSGYQNYKQIADAPPPSTAGVGMAPGSFTAVSETQIFRGFPFVREYTLSYADDINGEMCGAYAENPDGEPFTLSIKQQWNLFETLDGTAKMYPNYIYIRADAVPFVDRTNYITAYMTEDDVNEFAALLRRGVRLWLGQYSLLYVPDARRDFWAYAD